MFERFTDHARKAMAWANTEALALQHEHVGTEHLLLGLMHGSCAVAARVLKNLGVDVQALRREIEKLVPSKTENVTLRKPPHTSQVERAVKQALLEARSLNQNEVGTECFLLALIQDPESTAARVLLSAGLKLDTIREKVLALRASGYSDDWCPPDGVGMKPPESNGGRT